MGEPEVMPCPVFEGSEKRLEVDFFNRQGTIAGGLRCLTRGQLDLLLEKVRILNNIFTEWLLHPSLLTCIQACNFPQSAVRSSGCRSGGRSVISCLIPEECVRQHQLQHIGRISERGKHGKEGNQYLRDHSL